MGDVDVFIDSWLCERYWSLMEILALHGISSVWDVLDRPSFPWDYCSPLVAHGLSLTIDCWANAQGRKHANLDICLRPDDVALVPGSARWIYRPTPPDALKPLDATATGPSIQVGHQELLRHLAESDPQLSSRVMYPDLQMYFSA